jgi:hypothetical protein
VSVSVVATLSRYEKNLKVTDAQRTLRLLIVEQKHRGGCGVRGYSAGSFLASSVLELGIARDEL